LLRDLKRRPRPTHCCRADDDDNKLMFATDYVHYVRLEVFPWFSLSCKANAKVKLAKTGHGQHSSRFVICVVLFVIRVVLLLIVLFYVLFMCKCVLPPGVNPIAVNKYINNIKTRTQQFSRLSANCAVLHSRYTQFDAQLTHTLAIRPTQFLPTFF
jgi:hypothetical protein